jgi:hypothetical protein
VIVDENDCSSENNNVQVEGRITTRWSRPGIQSSWTNGASRFAIDGLNLLSWKAGVGESPGASARGRYPAFWDNFPRFFLLRGEVILCSHTANILL